MPNCSRTLLILLLQRTQAQEVVLESLDNGPGLLPFQLGPTKLISHYHSFLQYVDLADIKTKIEDIQIQVEQFRPQLNNQTLSLYEPHIEYLSSKLQKISEQLQTFEPDRLKRGLVDGLGSIVKSITGNLDYTDALRYDNAIKVLQDSEEKFQTEFNNHVSLNQNWTLENSKLISNLVENQHKIETVIKTILESDSQRETELIKYAHLAQFLLILGDNIDSLADELVRLENTFAFIRASSTPHSALDVKTLKYMLSRLNSIYNKDQILDINAREYYEIIKLGAYFTNKQLVLVFKFPIVSSKTYTLYRLSIVPDANHHAIIPQSPYIAVHESDSMYMETECPKTTHWYLCEGRANYQLQSQPDCIHQLIVTQRVDTLCKITTVTLTHEAVEQLDERHYSMNFPDPTKVRVICGKTQYRTLHGSYLATVPRGCSLMAPEFTVTNVQDRLQGQVLQIMEVPSPNPSQNPDTEATIKLNSVNLESLHTINSKISLQAPVHLNKATSDIIYHTTIPIYAILLSTAALVTALTIRKYCIGHKSKKVQDVSETPQKPTEIYAEIAPKPASRTDQITATFSKNVFANSS